MKQPFVDIAPVPQNQCGAALTIDVLGDRWSLLILRQILYGVARFDAIQSGTGCPRAILTKRLNVLCEYDLITKITYQSKGQRRRQAYVPKQAGWDFAKVMFALMRWGDAHLKSGKSALAIEDQQTGAPLVMDWVEEDRVQQRTLRLHRKWPDPEHRFVRRR